MNVVHVCTMVFVVNLQMELKKYFNNLKLGQGKCYLSEYTGIDVDL